MWTVVQQVHRDREPPVRIPKQEHSRPVKNETATPTGRHRNAPGELRDRAMSDSTGVRV